MTASPKILDFGLARIEREEPVPLDSDMPTLTMDEQPPSLTQGKGFMGTPSYMSPEQIEGRERTLFSASSVGAENLYQDYGVSSNGQRFVVVQNVDAGETPKITVVQNWIKKFEGQK